MTEAQPATSKAKRAAYMKKWRAGLSPERLEALNARRRGKSVPVCALPKEKVEAKRRSAREYMRRFTGNMSAAEKAAFLAKRREREIPQQRVRRAAMSDERRMADRQAERKWYARNRDRAIATQKVYRQAQKDKILDHYGRFCACCGEDEPVFLSLDHINGDGAAHRREISKRSGASMYSLLIREGFPAGFQVLCYNCNFAKRTGEACPHASISKTRLTANVVAFRS